MNILALIFILVTSYSIIRIIHSALWTTLDPYVDTHKIERRRNALKVYPYVGVVSFILFLLMFILNS